MPDAAVDIAGREHWDSVWKSLPAPQIYEGPVYEQHPVLARFLTCAPGRDAIEIGCVPGNFMVYLNKEFGYRVDGLDYCSNMDHARQNLLANGIRDFELFNVDLFDFIPPREYDLVFSAGFVEHFENYELVVRKHADLAKSGGLVVIWVPNLTHLHRWLCTLFAADLLKVHRFELMRRETLRHTLQRAGLKVLHCEYHKTFRPPYKLPKSIDLLSRAVQKAVRLCGLDDIGNRFASPYLISVSQKP